MKIFCSGAIYSAKIALFRSKKNFRFRILRKFDFSKKSAFFNVFLLIFLKIFCSGAIYSAKIALFRSKKKLFGSEFCENLIFRKNRHKTGPNHQYCDLEAEKLVYKLLILVLDLRVLFYFDLKKRKFRY